VASAGPRAVIPPPAGIIAPRAVLATTRRTPAVAPAPGTIAAPGGTVARSAITTTTAGSPALAHLSLPGDLHLQAAPAERLAVQLLDRGVSARLLSEHDEAEALGAAGPVSNQRDSVNLSKLLEQGLQLALASVIREIAQVQLRSLRSG